MVKHAPLVAVVVEQISCHQCSFRQSLIADNSAGPDDNRGGWMAERDVWRRLVGEQHQPAFHHGIAADQRRPAGVNAGHCLRV